MSDVLLVKLVPSADSTEHHERLFNNSEFTLVVEREWRLNFLVTQKSYTIDGKNAIEPKLSDIIEVLEIKGSQHNGSIIAIDKYPINQYREGYY